MISYKTISYKNFMSYKGNADLSETQRKDFDDLTHIVGYVGGFDLVGEYLTGWYKELLNRSIDTGYFYCPYIPLIKPPLITDPSTV